MKIDILKKLASIAEGLDAKGHFEESNVIDEIIQKISSKKPATKKAKPAAKKAKPAAKKDKPAKKDYDGDGKKETSAEEWMGSRDKAIKKNMKKD